MKTQLFASLLIASAATWMTGCSNPADDVVEADVTQAKKTQSVVDAPGTTYTLSVDSKIEFTGSKVTGSQSGGFNRFTGSFQVENGAILATGTSFEIDMDSTWSDSQRLTGHLKSPDFFDVASFPSSTFEATAIEKSGKGFNVTGNFKLHGISKSITFPATINVTSSGLTMNAEFFIKRNDFDIVYPGKPNDLIRNEVVIRLDIKAAPSA
ncbi:MAG TPA: YceI family protein [Verrucomicrobiales bacterium]|jgi:polyisoprenoid-binding protein YceI|nr:YceI family protein [Verrucomicrobiales bacterium]HIL71641.1 YceI family protein [Verrucomicrobiota bacterium]